MKKLYTPESTEETTSIILAQLPLNEATHAAQHRYTDICELCFILHFCFTGVVVVSHTRKVFFKKLDSKDAALISTQTTLNLEIYEYFRNSLHLTQTFSKNMQL